MLTTTLMETMIELTATSLAATSSVETMVTKGREKEEDEEGKVKKFPFSKQGGLF